ncbi:MAG: thiolase family protein [Gammaproteobacteria bacterium]
MSRVDAVRLPVLVAGARTAFLDSAGAYSPLYSYELGAQAIAGLMKKVPSLDARELGLVVMGTVLHEINTTNVARESMLAAGLPSRVPAYTVAMAGISPSVGVLNICDQIGMGRLHAGIAGGTENFSDVPIRLGRGVRRAAMKLRQAKSTGERLAALGLIGLRDLGLDLPASADFTTGLTMGAACEAMARKFGATRAESDAFAARSHRLAVEAIARGRFRDQLVPVTIDGVAQDLADNTPRADATVERLAKLSPVFDREHGVITAGNASRFTDGAGAVLLASRAFAGERGLHEMAVLRDYQLTGVDSLHEEMLLGPAMSIPRLLARNGLQYADIDAWEIHEAFATQVLVNRACMASAAFVADRFGAGIPVGEIPLEKLNTWGGSLSLGNPFAATGVRLLLTAAQRLQESGGRYAVISTCAGGGLGAAVLLENPKFVD